MRHGVLYSLVGCAESLRRVLLGLCFVCIFYGYAFSYNVTSTGEELCYSDTAQIACPKPGEDYYGQDGNYKAGIPMSYAADGWTVTDNVTGLMWDRYPYGTKQTQADNAAYCEALGLDGYNDWRMPSIWELVSIVTMSRAEPSWNSIFNGSFLDAGYLTQTANVNDANRHWGVNFRYWFSDNDADSKIGYMRCVRGAPVTRDFTANADGTVTDNLTGLVWEQDGSNTTMSWKEALAYCEARETPGHSDWRLPNVKELMTIIDYTKQGPAIFSAFSSNSASYWTSSTRNAHPNNGMYIDFTTGYTGYYYSKSTKSYVRCVCGGTTNVVAAVLSHTPSSPTTARTATITVGGSGVVAYKYRLDSGDWSEAATVSAPISLAGLSFGAHTLSVVGVNGNGVWQSTDASTTAFWTVVGLNPPAVQLLLLGE